MSRISTTLFVATLASGGLLGGDPGRGLAAAGQTAPPDPAALVTRADQALAALTSLEADFVQRVENRVLERTTTGRGTLTYRAPGRFRIGYVEPRGDLVVNDGTYVWIYLPSSQPGQVIRQPAAQSGVQNPLTYLRDLRGRYVVRHAGAEPIAGETTDHLALEPVGGSAPFERVDVWIGQSTRLLRQVRTSAADVTTTYTFQTLKRNGALAAGLFRFTPPRGVEIFDQ